MPSTKLNIDIKSVILAVFVGYSGKVLKKSTFDKKDVI